MTIIELIIATIILIIVLLMYFSYYNRRSLINKGIDKEDINKKIKTYSQIIKYSGILLTAVFIFIIIILIKI